MGAFGGQVREYTETKNVNLDEQGSLADIQFDLSCLTKIQYAKPDYSSLDVDMSLVPEPRPIYLIEGQNREKVKSDLLLVNDIQQQAIGLDARYRPLKLTATQLLFYPTYYESNGVTLQRSYCSFEANIHTPTGRVSKHPLILHWSADGFDGKDSWEPASAAVGIVIPQIFGGSLHGELEYLANGEVGRLRVIRWVDRGWMNRELYVIKATRSKDSMVITAIDRALEGIRERVYRKSR